MAVQHLVKTCIHTNTSDTHTQVNHIFNLMGAKASIDKLKKRNLTHGKYLLVMKLEEWHRE